MLTLHESKREETKSTSGNLQVVIKKHLLEGEQKEHCSQCSSVL